MEEEVVEVEVALAILLVVVELELLHLNHAVGEISRPGAAEEAVVVDDLAQNQLAYSKSHLGNTLVFEQVADIAKYGWRFFATTSRHQESRR